MVNIILFISSSASVWIMFYTAHSILWDAWNEQMLFEEIAKWSHIWYHICLQGHGYPYVAWCFFVAVCLAQVCFICMINCCDHPPKLPGLHPVVSHLMFICCTPPPSLFTLSSLSWYPYLTTWSPVPLHLSFPHAEQDMDVIWILIRKLKDGRKLQTAVLVKELMIAQEQRSYFKCLWVNCLWP